MKALVDRAAKWCAGIAVRDSLQARLTCGAIVNTVLTAEGMQGVIVGGTAVDTYVGGAFGTSESEPAGWQASLDIDTVVMHGLGGVPLSRAADALVAQGFERIGHGSTVRHPLIPFVVDFVGFGLPDDYSADHAYTILLDEWKDLALAPALLAGPEDILFDYTESGAHTHHARDWARALAIGDAMADRLDLGYLFTKAEWRLEGEFVAPLERVLRGEPLSLPGGLPPPSASR